MHPPRAPAPGQSSNQSGARSNDYGIILDYRTYDCRDWAPTGVSRPGSMSRAISGRSVTTPTTSPTSGYATPGPEDGSPPRGPGWVGVRPVRRLHVAPCTVAAGRAGSGYHRRGRHRGGGRGLADPGRGRTRPRIAARTRAASALPGRPVAEVLPELVTEPEDDEAVAKVIPFGVTPSPTGAADDALPGAGGSRLPADDEGGLGRVRRGDRRAPVVLPPAALQRLPESERAEYDRAREDYHAQLVMVSTRRDPPCRRDRPQAHPAQPARFSPPRRGLDHLGPSQHREDHSDHATGQKPRTVGAAPGEMQLKALPVVCMYRQVPRPGRHPEDAGHRVRPVHRPAAAVPLQPGRGHQRGLRSALHPRLPSRAHR